MRRPANLSRLGVVPMAAPNQSNVTKVLKNLIIGELVRQLCDANGQATPARKAKLCQINELLKFNDSRHSHARLIEPPHSLK